MSDEGSEKGINDLELARIHLNITGLLKTRMLYDFIRFHVPEYLDHLVQALNCLELYLLSLTPDYDVFLEIDEPRDEFLSELKTLKSILKNHESDRKDPERLGSMFSSYERVRWKLSILVDKLTWTL